QADAPSALTEIAAVRGRSGQTVHFLTAGHGRLLVTEEGPDSAGPTAFAGHTALEIFQSLAPPGTPVPPALEAAIARVGVGAAVGMPGDGLGMTEHAVSILGPSPGPCPSAWFQAHFCPSGDQKWCLLSHWNGAFFFNTSVNSMVATVCPFQGNV